MHSIFRGNMEMWANEEKNKDIEHIIKTHKFPSRRLSQEEEEGTLNTAVLPKGLWWLWPAVICSPSQTKVTKLMTQRCRMTVISEKHGHTIPFVYTNLNSIFES